MAFLFDGGGRSELLSPRDISIVRRALFGIKYTHPYQTMDRKRKADVDIGVDRIVKESRMSSSGAWKLVVFIIEHNNVDVNVREVILEHSNPEELLDMCKQQVQARGWIVASLYNDDKLVKVYDGLIFGTTRQLEESAPPNIHYIYETWMGQPKTTHDWADYERDMRLIKEFDRFSTTDMAIIREYHDWRMHEEYYNHQWELFD